MFPDLRLLITATVATFFLAATAGLYTSLRIAQDQIVGRTDALAPHEDSPIMRIAAAWPPPEPGRAMALRELTQIMKDSLAVPKEPARTPDPEIQVEPDTAPSSPPVVAEDDSQASPTESPAQDATDTADGPDSTGSTGNAVQPETGASSPSPHPDIHGNIGNVAALPKADAVTEKKVRRAAKPTVVVPRKPTVKVQRRKKTVRAPESPVDLSNSGYPLYLTVPVTH